MESHTGCFLIIQGSVEEGSLQSENYLTAPTRVPATQGFVEEGSLQSENSLAATSSVPASITTLF
jgi:hypothetical protein